MRCQNLCGIELMRAIQVRLHSSIAPFYIFNLEYLSLFIGICYNTAIVSIFHIAQLIANGEVSIDKYSSRRSRGECSPMLTEPKANNCFSIIFRGEC